MNLLPLEDVVRIIGLKPLIGEGGMRKQTYISDETLSKEVIPGRTTDRTVCSAIHYLITPGSFSCMHKLESDELWYFHMGAPVEVLLIYPDGTSVMHVLGHDLAAGHLLQLTVPRGAWMGAQQHAYGEYSLLSTSMAPGYADEEFVAGTYEALLPLLSDPAHEPALRRMTGEPQYE